MSMYKSVVIAAMIIASSTTDVLAQKGQYLTIGPVMGVGGSWIDKPGTYARPSAHLGMSIIYSKNEHWGIGGVTTISHEGYSFDVVRNGVIYTNTIDPVYMRMTPRGYYFFGKQKDNARFKLFAGPSLGIKLTEERNMSNALPPSDFINNPRYTEFNVLDLGMNTGAGLNVKVAKNIWVNIDGEYYHGVANATTDGDMNRNLRGNVGVLFGL